MPPGGAPRQAHVRPRGGNATLYHSCGGQHQGLPVGAPGAMDPPARTTNTYPTTTTKNDNMHTPRGGGGSSNEGRVGRRHGDRAGVEAGRVTLRTLLCLSTLRRLCLCLPQAHVSSTLCRICAGPSLARIQEHRWGRRRRGGKRRSWGHGCQLLPAHPLSYPPPCVFCCTSLLAARQPYPKGEDAGATHTQKSKPAGLRRTLSLVVHSKPRHGPVQGMQIASTQRRRPPLGTWRCRA